MFVTYTRRDARTSNRPGRTKLAEAVSVTCKLYLQVTIGVTLSLTEVSNGPQVGVMPQVGPCRGPVMPEVGPPWGVVMPEVSPRGGRARATTGRHHISSPGSSLRDS